MSSIPQKESVMRSPIPRSRSDFSYIGLTPKEKRWTTDFSLLLPPFPRDTSGYSRLAESPVTHQPKPRQEETRLDNRSTTQQPNAYASSRSNNENFQTKMIEPHTCTNLINPKTSPRSDTAHTATLQSHSSTATNQYRTLSPSPESHACSRPSTDGLKPPTTEPSTSKYTSESIESRMQSQNKEPPSSRQVPTNKNVIPTTKLCQDHIPQQHHTSSKPTSDGLEPKTLGRSQTMELHTTRHIIPISERTEPRTIGRSQTAELVTSQSINFNEVKRTKPVVRKSPTLEPYNPKCNSTSGSKKLYPTVELSSIGGSLAITRIRNPLTHPLAAEVNHPNSSTLESSRNQRTNPFTSESNRSYMTTSETSPHLNCHTATLEGSRHLNCHFTTPESCRHLKPNPSTPQANRQPLSSPQVSRHLTPEASRHLMSIRKSPTMDSRTLRYSPLLSQHIISRSPTLDPGALSRSPHCGFRSPLSGRVMSTSEVVRSQSMKSLRKAMDRSPAKVRNSESAQTDITCPIHRAFPLVEADEYDVDDYRRLRNFSVTNKGVINWGDSFRSQSLTSVPDPAFSCSSSQWDVASTKSYPMTSSNTQWTCNNRTPQRYRVAIIGAEEVGKTSLIRQFQTSEYICAFDPSYGEKNDINKEYAITVILNKEESELEFIEHRLNEEGDGDASSSCPSIPWADAHVVVYSVTSRRSFSRACELLASIRKTNRRSAVLLVGNKSDLVRVRAITTDDGQTAAKDEGSPFIETSAAINHQVDELLVAILTRIRANATTSSSSASRWRHSSLSRAKGLIKKFLKKACFQSKSSDSLQRL